MKDEMVIVLPKFYLTGFLVGTLFALSCLIPTYMYMYTSINTIGIVLTCLFIGIPLVWVHSKLVAKESRVIGHCARSIAITVSLAKAMEDGTFVPENKGESHEM